MHIRRVCFKYSIWFHCTTGVKSHWDKEKAHWQSDGRANRPHENSTPYIGWMGLHIFQWGHWPFQLVENFLSTFWKWIHWARYPVDHCVHSPAFLCVVGVGSTTALGVSGVRSWYSPIYLWNYYLKLQPLGFKQIVGYILRGIVFKSIIYLSYKSNNSKVDKNPLRKPCFTLTLNHSLSWALKSRNLEIILFLWKLENFFLFFILLFFC